MCSAQNFGDTLTGIPVASARLDHLLIDAFRMHVDFDLAAGTPHAIEYGAPEIVAAFGYTAFAVDAKVTPLIAGQARRSAVSASRQYGPWLSALSPSIV